MDGTILNFDSVNGVGVIRAGDGKRYKFATSDWASAGSPSSGDIVDFEPVDGVASEIFVTGRIAEATPVSATPMAEVKANPPAPAVSPVPPVVVELRPETVAVAQTPPPVQMPSGLGARYFIAYAVTLIPTYVLPYFGSNSLLVNGLASGVGGMPVQFWWHISCYAVLMFLAFIRGARIARLWLVAFPLLSAIFDLMPVINNIPLAPTVFSIAALYIGSSRSAPEGYVPENLNQKIEFGLWSIAAFSAFAIFKIWTSPFSAGSGFAGSLLLWPVLGLAVFFAMKYRSGEGAAIVNDLTSRFDSSTNSDMQSFAEEQGIVSMQPTAAQELETEAAQDAVSAVEPNPDEVASAPQFFKRGLPYVLTAVAVLGLTAVGGVYFFGKPALDADDCTGANIAARPECATAAEPDIIGQKVAMFIVADANVRDRATAKGSRIIDKMFRGNSVSGVMQLGEDGTSRWVKLDKGAGYIGAVNLSKSPPPTLAKTFQDMKWDVEEETALLAAPIAGSTEVARLFINEQTTVAGVTANGYAEVKRTKGGVGYFLITSTNDRMDVLSVNEAHMDSDIVNDTPAGVAESEKNAVPFLTRGANPLVYDGQIGDQMITLVIESNTERNLLFLNAEYRNVRTKKTCGSMLVFKQFNADQTLDFKQGITKNYASCGQFPDVNLTVLASNDHQGPSPEILLRWTLNGKIVMEGELQKMNPY